MSTPDLLRIRDLLPGYLNKTLLPNDQAFMDTWMREHSQQHPELMQEMHWLALTRQQLRDSTTPINPEAGWHELLARIEASPRPSKAVSSTWRSRLGSWLSSPLLTASACAVVFAQAVVLWAVWPDSGDSVRLMSSNASSPSSSSPASGLVNLQIVFKETATVAQVRAALGHVQGNAVNGPSALGIWRMAVPAASAEQSIRLLKTQVAVESVAVEP